MIGYKGFNQGFKSIDLCKKEFHFYEHPFDVLHYHYDPNDVYAEIKASGEIEHFNNRKTSTCSEIELKKELSLQQLVDKGVEIKKELSPKLLSASDKHYLAINSLKDELYNKESIKDLHEGVIDSNSLSVCAIDNYVVRAEGIGSKAIGTGNSNTVISSSTPQQRLDLAKSEVDSTPPSLACATGRDSMAINLNKESAAITTQPGSRAINDGEKGVAVSLGSYNKAVSNGDKSIAITTGKSSLSVSSGLDSLAIALGEESRARTGVGGFIVLTERNASGTIIKIHSARVGQTIQDVLILPHVEYWFYNGKLCYEYVGPEEGKK